MRKTGNGILTFDQFQQFIHKFPGLLSPAISIQQNLQMIIIGERFWNRCSKFRTNFIHNIYEQKSKERNHKHQTLKKFHPYEEMILFMVGPARRLSRYERFKETQEQSITYISYRRVDDQIVEKHHHHHQQQQTYQKAGFNSRCDTINESVSWIENLDSIGNIELPQQDKLTKPLIDKPVEEHHHHHPQDRSPANRNHQSSTSSPRFQTMDKDSKHLPIEVKRKPQHHIHDTGEYEHSFHYHHKVAVDNNHYNHSKHHSHQHHHHHSSPQLQTKDKDTMHSFTLELGNEVKRKLQHHNCETDQEHAFHSHHKVALENQDNHNHLDHHNNHHSQYHKPTLLEQKPYLDTQESKLHSNVQHHHHHRNNHHHQLQPIDIRCSSTEIEWEQEINA
jgi:hypothetical protein